MLESTLEELEIEKAAEAPDEETFSDAEDAKPLPTRRKRKMFPKPLTQVQKNFKRKRPVSPAYWLRFGAAVSTVEPQDHGPETPDHGPRASDHGAFTVGMVDSFGFSFIW